MRYSERPGRRQVLGNGAAAHPGMMKTIVDDLPGNSHADPTDAGLGQAAGQVTSAEGDSLRALRTIIFKHDPGPRNTEAGVPTLCINAEGNIAGGVSASSRGTPRGRRTMTCARAREPAGPVAARPRGHRAGRPGNAKAVSLGCTARAVGSRHGTCDPAEQRRLRRRRWKGSELWGTRAVKHAPGRSAPLIEGQAPGCQPFGDSGFDFLRLPLAVADCNQVVRSSVYRITIGESCLSCPALLLSAG